MNAYRIISDEYRQNQSSVFIFINGEYYGDMAYPRLRNFPQDVNYWMTATSSDSDRFFKVEEVEINGMQVAEMKSKHKAIDENNKNLIPYMDCESGLTFNEREAIRQKNIWIDNHNREFQTNIFSLLKEIRNIILALS